MTVSTCAGAAQRCFIRLNDDLTRRALWKDRAGDCGQDELLECTTNIFGQMIQLLFQQREEPRKARHPTIF